MKKLIFILMAGILFAQSEKVTLLDELILLNGKYITGKYISSHSQHISFKPEGFLEEQIIEKSIIDRVVLADGVIIFTAENIEEPIDIDGIQGGFYGGGLIWIGGILLAIETNNPPTNIANIDTHKKFRIFSYVLIAIGGLLISIG